MQNNYQIGDIVTFEGKTYRVAQLSSKEYVESNSSADVMVLSPIEDIGRYVTIRGDYHASISAVSKDSIPIVLKFVVIREKATGKIWDAAFLPDDEDKYVYLSTSSQGSVSEFSKAYNDFTNNFAGTNNAIHFKDTQYFTVEYIEKSLTFH